MATNAIELENITKKFNLKKSHLTSQTSVPNNDDKLVALDNVSIKIPKGEMVGIIGLNGSGKTTLLRMIAGILVPDSGIVKTDGLIAPLLQIGTGFHNELLPSDNIIMYGMLLGMSKSEIKEKIPNIMKFAELEKFSNMRLKHFSAGMRARLGFSTALRINPEILLVDEVLSVGDMSFREKSFKAFLTFKESGKTILYTTHNMGMISELSDRVLLLHHGKLIMVGKPEETLQKYKEIVGKK